MLRLAARVVGVLFLVVGLYLVSLPVRIWWDARSDDTDPVDAVLVMGAAQYDGRPSPVLEARLRKARELYEAGVAPKIVTTGGGAEGDRTTEADASREWLVENRVPAEDVVAVPVGSSTQDSLEAAGDEFADQGWETAVIVTDPWHTFRAKAIAGSYGIEAGSAPARTGPVVQTRTAQLRYILRESGAYLEWRVTGETGAGGPDAF